MSVLDNVVVGLYFAAVFAVAWWAMRQNKNKATDYFLAGRELGWVAVGASLFVSNIGSEHLVGLTGTGAASGLAVGHFEWLASFILLFLGWFFVPFYLRSGVVTMPEFLEKRYNAASRWYFTFISVIGYVLTKISVGLFAGGLIIQEVTGLSFWVGAVVVLVFTGLYTILGGLRAVVYTDVIQTVVLLVGSVLLVVFGLQEVGGWSALQQSAPEGFFSIWKPASHPDFPWTGIVFGAPILGVWYWCTDQYIVQRTLSARNLDQARKGTIFAAYLKVLPVFLFVLPGVIAAVLFKEITPETSNRALPVLVMSLFGPGLKGLFLAALLAALMSSLSSVFNSCSTLLTWDIFKKIKPKASEKTLIFMGRLNTTVLVVIGLLWIPFMKYVSSQLYIYLQSVQGYIAPPIAAVFLFGLLIKRLNGAGAMASLLSGLVLGSIRLILEILNGPTKTKLASGSALEWVAEINFLHFAAFLFIVCSVILFAVSYMSEKPEKEKLSFLQKPDKKAKAPNSLLYGLSIGLVILVVGLMVLFA